MKHQISQEQNQQSPESCCLFENIVKASDKAVNIGVIA